MTNLILYYKIYSPPCRATLFTLLALNLTYEERLMDSKTIGPLRHEFEIRNPHHTIPTIVEDDFVLWDSHAINTYLANKYDETNMFYPTDPRQRAIVDHRIHFDNEILFPFLRGFAREIVRHRTVKEVTIEHTKQFNEKYALVETLFTANTLQVDPKKPKKRKFIAGDNLTIADFHHVTTLTTMNIFVPIGDQEFPNTVNYLKLCKTVLPNYTLNEIGVEAFRKFVSVAGFEFP